LIQRRFLTQDFNAGLRKAQDDDHSFGQGARGMESDLARLLPIRLPLSSHGVCVARIFSEDRGIIGWERSGEAFPACGLNMHSWRTGDNGKTHVQFFECWDNVAVVWATLHPDNDPDLDRPAKRWATVSSRM